MSASTMAALTDEDYAAIGRAVAEHAEARAQRKLAREKAPDYGKAIHLSGYAVQVRFSAPEPVAGHLSPENRPIMCCMCFLENDVVICKGACCEV